MHFQSLQQFSYNILKTVFTVWWFIILAISRASLLKFISAQIAYHILFPDTILFKPYS